MKSRKTKFVSNRGIIYSLTKQRAYWLMLLPTIIFFIVFAYLPMTGVYMAFTRYDYQAGIFGSRFIGLSNFKYLFGVGTDGGFFGSIIWALTKRTLLYNLAFIIFGNALQVIVSIMLKEISSNIFKKTSQTLMFMPYFISYAVVGVIAYNILSSNGVINTILSSIGMNSISFYQNSKYWPAIIIIFNIWKGLGYGTVVYFATLTGMDESIYEAAYIDGASRLQRIWRITLPMLRPTIVILILFSLGGILRGQFDLFYNLVQNNSILYDTTDIIDTYVYRAIAVNPNLSLGSAAGFYQSVFGLVFVCAVNAIVKKLEPDYALF